MVKGTTNVPYMRCKDSPYIFNEPIRLKNQSTFLKPDSESK